MRCGGPSARTATRPSTRYDLTGEAPIYVEAGSGSRSRGRHASRSEGRSQSYTERARRLLLPDEVRRLPRGQQLPFVKGLRPIRAQKLNYLQNQEFRTEGIPAFEENPMHASPSSPTAGGFSVARG